MLKSWAFYQIYTTVVIMRDAFLTHFDDLLKLREPISSALGSTEDAEFYKWFIRDPMLNRDYSSFN